MGGRIDRSCEEYDLGQSGRRGDGEKGSKVGRSAKIGAYAWMG